MKRTFAILLVVAMLAAFCVVFASAEEKEIIDLMPTSPEAWTVTICDGNGIDISVADGVSVFQGENKGGSDWPSAAAAVSASVKAEDYSLVFDFDIEGDTENPRGAISFDSAYPFGCDVIKNALSYERTGEDFYTDNGHYALTIKLTELKEAVGLDWGKQWADLFDSDGNFTVSGLQVFACGGAKVTVNKLQLVPNELANKVPLWNETESIAEDGNYSYGVAYGFDFDIDYFNGVIKGEDASVISTADAYSVCNPNWAITLQLKDNKDGTYTVVRDPIVTPGSAEGAQIEWADDTVLLVVHSSTSSKEKAEEKGYDNWQQKVVAIAVQVGDVLTFTGVDFEAGTVEEGAQAHVAVPGGSSDTEPDPDPEPDPDDGYEAAIDAKVGAANDSNLFKTELEAELGEDGAITLNLTISGLKAEDKVIGFQIPVYFDAERAEPDLSDIKEEALNVVAEDGMPGKNWENLTAAKVVEKNGESYIYFQCGTAKTDYCDENTELVATFKFKLKEGFDKAGFWTANATTKCFIDDGLMTTKLGEGTYCIAEEAGVPAPTPTPTPTPTPEPTPGDAGIIVFAVLGVLALAGVAVVIKVRSK